MAKCDRFSIVVSVLVGTKMSSVPRADGHQSRSRNHVTGPMPCSTVAANWDSSTVENFADRFITRFSCLVMMLPHCERLSRGPMSSPTEK